MRLFLAIRTFFTVLSNKQKATEIQKFLAAPNHTLFLPSPSLEKSNSNQPVSKTGTNADRVTAQSGAPSKSASMKTALSNSSRSEAITLLSALQREARLIDLVSEPLDQYSDAQIGAAARDVIRDTKKCLHKLFDIQPLVGQNEGSRIEVPEQPSPVRWKIIGGAGKSGTVIHPGWVAAKVELPSWSGNPDDCLVLSAAEVET